ncbi:PAS domain S-box protein [Flavobacterium frigoris]|uniref:Sensory box histidine kinase/response regulator n=1 Tax=Flavobacterium frigoris (strain PS1) TaxID=1086011 RepID=H7FPB0_FLAFP|nr:PAS domain S-box protein [Flavobacterium frigoris]EIA09590.1 sensory box histidine kinase/response regulator [Flavobacterium frigoris PS1]
MNSVEQTKLLLNESSLFYIITTDMDGNYSYVNQNYAKEFLHINSNFVGQPYHITMHPDDISTCLEVSTKCFEHPGKLFKAIIRKHDGEGDYIYTQWEYKAMFDDEKNPAGVFCLGHNITKYIAEQIQLKKAIEENEKKSIIIENIVFQQSHLVRAPLSNLIGLTTVFLDKTLLDSDTSYTCQMILESTRQLDEIIRNIVTTART